MTRILIGIMVVFCCLFYAEKSFSISLTGGVEVEDYLKQNKLNAIYDNETGKAVTNAKVSVPLKGYNTRTDSNGYFKLDADLNGPTILSVDADGYKPYSLTIDKQSTRKPLMLGIDKQSELAIVIDSNIHHLGDDNYSANSANSGDFRASASGPKFIKSFSLGGLKAGKRPYLKVGSVIGLDTQTAHRISQSRTSSYSSPLKVYINSKKIGEIRINGDNQAISIPISSLNIGGSNTVAIETGRNVQKTDFIDYDDMEFMNILLEYR